MDAADQHHGFVSRRGSTSRFQSGTHETTVYDGSDDENRIWTPPSSSPRVFDICRAIKQVRAQPATSKAQQKQEAPTFFMRLAELSKLRPLFNGEESQAVYHSCATMYYYSAAGRTVWRYLTDETRANLKYGWESQIFEAKGSETAHEPLCDLYAHLLDAHNEQCNQTTPDPMSRLATFEIVKSRLFETLMIAATADAPKMGEFCEQLKIDLNVMMDSAGDDDVIEVLCLSRITHPGQQIFIRASDRWSRRIHELSEFLGDLDAQLKGDGYVVS